MASVTLYYRTSGLSAWEVDGDPDEAEEQWTASLDGADIMAPGLEYYFKGIDDSPFQALTLLPEGAPSAPFELPVQVVGTAIPFVEDFEVA